MSVPIIAIEGIGLVTSVGMTAAASCAAFRAKISNPSETRFIDSAGEWIMGHQVALDSPWRGLTKLAKMAALAADEALRSIPEAQWQGVPCLLCVAEPGRPGRTEGLDDRLFTEIQKELGFDFGHDSAVLSQGRLGLASALMRCRELLQMPGTQRVLLVAVDSLLSWPTLSHYETRDRLLTSANSDGFMPGEAAGACLISASREIAGELICVGIGFGHEAAHVSSSEPMRADGLTTAIKAALEEAEVSMHDMDFRVTDNSGEQYYFKEAALALLRTLRKRKETFEMWHPSECFGEIGSVSGFAMVAAAAAACRKGYSKGDNVLIHWANDDGGRAVLTLRYRGPA